MPTVPLIAVKRFKRHAPGQSFEATARDAHVLKLLGIAKDAPRRVIAAQASVQTKDLGPDVAIEPEGDALEDGAVKKRVYRRRDMKAEAE